MTEVEETEIASPLFELQLSSGPVFAPTSLDEVEAWVGRERQAWQWLNEARKADKQIDHIFNLQFLHEKAIAQHLLAARDSVVGGEPFRQAVERIGQALFARYGKHKALLSETPEAAFLAIAASRDPVVAAHALWAMMNKQPQGAEHPEKQFKGQVLAALFGMGLAEMPKWEADAWDALRARVNKEHQELRQDADTLKMSFDEMHRVVEARMSQNASLFDAAHIDMAIITITFAAMSIAAIISISITIATPTIMIITAAISMAISAAAHIAMIIITTIVRDV